MSAQVADVYDLQDFFLEQRDRYLSILPPAPDFTLRQHGSPSLLTFEWKSFPPEFVESLAPEYENSVPVFPVTILEDAVTRETVFLNGEGKKIWSLPSIPNYDPYAYVKCLYPGLYTGMYSKDWVSYVESLYDPARIEIQVKLIPAQYVEQYLYTGARIDEAQAESVTLLGDEEGGGVMLLFSEEWTNHLWLGIRGPGQGSTDGIEITLHLPQGWTNMVEVYTFDASSNNTFKGMASSPWLLGMTNRLVVETNEIIWLDTDTGETESRFYVAGNGDLDTDGDGLADARELFMHHTDPNWADTDGDGVSDGAEVSTGTNPNNPNDPPNVKGTVFYNGQQTNAIRVLAVTDSNSWSLAHSVTINEPGGYQIPNLPASNYWLKAFRDLNNNGALDEIEARGEYAVNPVEITGQVTGIDITLTDPDSDGDGLSDYEEIMGGGDPHNASDGKAAIMNARQRISINWSMVYATPLVLTNAPGSAADLQDLDNALQSLSGKFVKPQ
ncbi:MAG: thrombospondin type 3 repeat-containing protein [Verrucomicrobia bacterium]|nr:thrombospondin type 3 repeat-containing protein [Verrucomicrobiota bacterium]